MQVSISVAIMWVLRFCSNYVADVFCYSYVAGSVSCNYRGDCVCYNYAVKSFYSEYMNAYCSYAGRSLSYNNACGTFCSALCR